MFERIQAAYERLQAGVAGGQGPQRWRILLLLRAQAVLYRRYPQVMQPFKYAGYSLLLQGLAEAVGLPAPGSSTPATATASAGSSSNSSAAQAAPAFSSDLASRAVQQEHASAAGSTAGARLSTSSMFVPGRAETVEEVSACAELMWLTCASSRLNANELLRAGGLDVLAGLLTRCVSGMTHGSVGGASSEAEAGGSGRRQLQEGEVDVAPTAPAAVLAASVLRCIASLAGVEEARAPMAQHGALLADVVR